MSEAIPLTITIASLPPDWSGNIYEYDATIPGRIQIVAQQNISLFQASTTEPGSDVGLWFDRNTYQWKYFDYDAGEYRPVVVPQTNLKYSVSAEEPNPSEFLLWVVLNGSGQGIDIRTYFNSAWRSILVGGAFEVAIFGSAGTGLQSVPLEQAGYVLTSNGPAAAPSFQVAGGLPAGTLIQRSVAAAPAGFLPAAGGAYSRAAYPTLNALYQAEGYPWGAGDGVNTFNVPNLNGRVGLGDGLGTASDATPRVVGDLGGTERVKLTQPDIPAATTSYNLSPGAEGPVFGIINTSNTSHGNMPPFATVRWFVKT